MSEHERDDGIEDLDATEEEAEDVKGGLNFTNPAAAKIEKQFGDGSVTKLNPSVNLQWKLGGG